MPLQIRRGTTAERLSITPLVGEPVFDTTLSQIFVGDGNTAGGVRPDISAETIEEALDTVGAALANGAHQNISFAYGSEQDAANRIDATVSIATLLEDLDLNEFGIVGNGNINITGQITGQVTGDLTGSVFADNSTMLIDGTNGRIVGPVFANVTGSVLASDSTVIVNSATKSIVVDNLEVTNLTSTVNSNSRLIFKQQDSTTSSVFIEKNSNDITNPATLTFQTSRGTLESPTAVTIADRLGVFNFRAYDGTNFFGPAQIRTDVAGPVSLGIIPTATVFSNSDGTGTFLESARLDHNRGLILTRTGAAAILSAFQSIHDSNVDTGSFSFTRSRGSILNPTAIVENDSIVDLAFSGRTGAPPSFPTTLAFIRTSADGPVSTNVIPGRLEFHTANLAGVLNRNMVLNNSGTLRVERIESLTTNLTITAPTISEFLKLPVYANDTARNTTISSPTQGMIIFMQSGTAPAATNQIQYFDGSVWQNL